MNLLPFTVESFEWSLDPAASGPRWRAFDGAVELCAYEDGRYQVSKAGKVFATGDASLRSDTQHLLQRAKEITVSLYNIERGASFPGWMR